MAGIVERLVPAFPRIVVTATASDRAMPPAELARLVLDELDREGRDSSCLIGTFPCVRDALDDATERGMAIVAAGTITLAGEVAALLR